MSTNETLPDFHGQEKQYFVLLVAINDYPSPVSALGGCVSDINKIESYLKTNIGIASGPIATQLTPDLLVNSYGPLHICRLENAQATYSKITSGFRDFLRGAGNDDTVWFHFSGHGSEQFTAKEFLDIEPNGKDQTLVCFSRPGGDDLLHLADKELAVLLHQVDSQDIEGAPKKSPHIVVSLDCCHSGSGTRDFEMDPDLKSRNAQLNVGLTRQKAEEEKTGIRNLNSYAGGYYLQQWNEAKHLQVPLSSHILLSACESVQLAADRPDGGIFTAGLIDALTGAGGNLNYYDLYVRTRATVKSARGNQQTPQFETIGGFNSYTRFLDGSALGNPNRYDVVKDGTRWLIKCGAIQGIPMLPDKPVQVEIQTQSPENKPIGIAELTLIGAQQSTLTKIEHLHLDSNKPYQAILKSFPVPPILVWVHGDPPGVQALRDAWDEKMNILMVKDINEFGGAQLEVEVSGGEFRISDRRSGREVKKWSVNAPNANLTVVDILGKMVNWERFISLQNENSAIKNWVSLEIDVAKNPVRPFATLKETETVLIGNDTDYLTQNGGLGAFFIPRLVFHEKPDQKLYAYLFHLRSNFAITCYEGEVVYRPDEFKDHRSVEIKLWKQFRGWGLGPGEKSAFCYFKLIVTTEALAYQQLLQSDIEGDRAGFDLDLEPYAIENEWWSQTLKVVLERTS